MNIRYVEITINNNIHVKVRNDEPGFRELIRIISLFEGTKDETVLDADEYYIKVVSDEKEEIISGKGNYPKTYNQLLEWISNHNE